MLGSLRDVLAAVDQQVEGVEGEVGVAAPSGSTGAAGNRACPSRSSATASPSIRQPAGKLAAALTIARNLSLQSLPLRVQAVAAPPPVGDQQPIAVIFILVQPVGAGRHRVDQGRQLRRLERRRRLPRLLLRAARLAALAIGVPDVGSRRRFRPSSDRS